MKKLQVPVVPMLALTLIGAAITYGYRCEPAPRPAAATDVSGPYGTFTYTAIDGSSVTVGRQAPPEATVGPENSDELDAPRVP